MSASPASAVNKLPYPTSIGPGGNASEFLGNFNGGVIGSHVLPIGSTRNYDQVGQAKLEGQWTEDHLQLKFGVSYLSDRENLSEYDDFANNDWQAFPGYGPASNNFYIANVNPADPYYGQPAGVALPQNLFTKSFSTAGFINGFGNNGNLPARILQYNPIPVLNYLQSLGNPQAGLVPGYNGVGAGCCSPAYDGVYRIILSPGSFRQIYEENYAAYFTLNMQTSIGGMPLKVAIGAREEQTSVHSAGPRPGSDCVHRPAGRSHRLQHLLWPDNGGLGNQPLQSSAAQSRPGAPGDGRPASAVGRVADIDEAALERPHPGLVGHGVPVSVMWRQPAAIRS